MIWKSGAGFNQCFMNIYMDFSYNHKIMKRGHGPHLLHIDVDEKRTPQRRQGHALAWIPAYHWCRKHDLYNVWSRNNNQQQGCYIPSLLMSAYLEQFKVDGASDDD